MFEDGDIDGAFDRIISDHESLDGADLAEIMDSAREVLKLTEEQIVAVHKLIEEGIITLADMEKPEVFLEKVKQYIEGSVGN